MTHKPSPAEQSAYDTGLALRGIRPYTGHMVELSFSDLTIIRAALALYMRDRHVQAHEASCGALPAGEAFFKAQADKAQDVLTRIAKAREEA
jgi:hypothetical protein